MGLALVSRQVLKSPPSKTSSASLGLSKILYTRLHINRVPFIFRLLNAAGLYHFCISFCRLQEWAQGSWPNRKTKQETYRASKQARIILGKFFPKNASTYTFEQTAALCGDICPRAIISIPLWRWIRACARTSPVSPSTSHAAWLPWRPLAPTTIHCWLEQTIHGIKLRFKGE